MTAVILRAARMKMNICLLITNITLTGPTEPTAPTVTCPRPTVPTNTNRPGRSSRETVPASPLCVKTCTNITGPVLEILNNVNAVFHHPLQCFAFHVLVFFIGKRSLIIKAPFRFNATHFSLLAGEWKRGSFYHNHVSMLHFCHHGNSGFLSLVCLVFIYMLYR